METGMPSLNSGKRGICLALLTESAEAAVVYADEIRRQFMRLLVAFLFTFGGLLAQTVSTQILGLITDASGAVAAMVTVAASSSRMV